MNISNEHEVTIYKHDGQYGVSYSVGLSKKKQDGSYENGFLPVRFRKDVEIEDKTKLFIKNAWLSFNVKDKKTYPYIFINEYTLLDDAINPKKDETPKEEKKEENDPYQEFAEETEITDADLPF